MEQNDDAATKYNRYVKQAFEAMDKNGDGVLSRAEMSCKKNESPDMLVCLRGKSGHINITRPDSAPAGAAKSGPLGGASARAAMRQDHSGARATVRPNFICPVDARFSDSRQTPVIALPHTTERESHLSYRGEKGGRGCVREWARGGLWVM